MSEASPKFEDYPTTPRELVRRIAAQQAFLGINQNQDGSEHPHSPAPDTSTRGSAVPESNAGYTIHVKRDTGEWRIT